MKRHTKIMALFLSALLAIQLVSPAMTVFAEENQLNIIREEEVSVIPTEPATPSEADVDEDLATASESEMPATISEMDGEIEDDVSDEATPSEIEEGIRSLIWTDGEFELEVRIPEGAFEEDREIMLEVVPLTQEAIDSLTKSLGDKADDSQEAVGFDVRLVGADGNELVPRKAVTMTMRRVDSVFTDAVKSVDVYHFSDATGKDAEVIATDRDATEEVDAVMNHFSPILMLGSSSSGDLWNKWTVSLDIPGDGTNYTIGSVENLMALSEMTANGTLDTKGKTFTLQCDLDLSGVMTVIDHWNPIGWYQTKAQAGAGNEPAHPFKGTFDGAGHTISGLDFISNDANFQYIGLFGLLDGAVVRDLNITCDTVSGYDYIGILAGKAKGTTQIHDVTVSGAVNAGISCVSCSSDAKTGGLIGAVSGNSLSGTTKGSSVQFVTIENCTADYVTVNSNAASGATGGIAGSVTNAYLVDNKAVASSQRIQGKGYVGGIAGRMSSANIYNSYVDGTIGGSGSTAAGGIVGKHEGGNVILARFAGLIGSTYAASAHEGIFIGTRDASDKYSYGMDADDNIAYLFTNETNKAKAICGSLIPQDLTATKDAHIGYWTNNELKYVLKNGAGEVNDPSRFFYEELEDGVRHVVTNKIGRSFTASDFANGLPFMIDHFAPGASGEPERGYLLSVPRIDTLNADGTTDQDVATFVAYPRQNGTYYRSIDKDSASAVMPGETVTVLTASKNTDGKYYQMVVNASEAGGVEPPTYLDEDGAEVKMTYLSSGAYSFVMPECNTQMNVEYIKTTSTLTMSPAETQIHVIQYRSGDRKHPVVYTEVRDAGNVLLSTNAAATTPTMDQISPIKIKATHNASQVGADKTHIWSTDNADLLSIPSSGYIETEALVRPNINGKWLNDTINALVKNQADGGYQKAIADTVYQKTAIVTATTKPETSSSGVAVYGNSNVTVTLQIIDDTKIKVEDISLSDTVLSFSIKRMLTGYRTSPTEQYAVTGPKKLTAILSPDNPFLDTVTWTADENAKTAFMLTPNGKEYTITPKFDKDSGDNPAWVQNLISTDDDAWKADKSVKRTGTGATSGKVTVTADDTSNGTKQSVCTVNISFETIDSTFYSRADVTFNPNGGTGSMATQTILDGKETALNANAFTRSGYYFSSWNTDPSGRGSSYADRQGVTFTSDVTLYAIWGRYSSGGGGGSGSSGGSGGGGTGPSGEQSGGSIAGIPSYVITNGRWVQSGNGSWMYISDHTLTNEWAALYNPYAAAGQPKYDWYYFGADSAMVTGWYTDPKSGESYYLHPLSDSRQGYMYTGKMLLPDGIYYYFNENSDGKRGALMKNYVSADGSIRTNAKGQMIDSTGKVTRN